MSKNCCFHKVENWKLANIFF
uniref:Uncharacterized protein n=1 Tax=Arundo donax TaxID=35708 RepID=A0A0A9AQP6_ARUDO